MKFTSLGSSSKGNAYLLRAENAPPLLLEAGFPINRLRDKLREHRVMLSGLAGVLASHEHGDHARAVKDLLSASVDCYLSQGTAEALGVEAHHRFHPLRVGSTEELPGGWRITPFSLEHDAKEPLGVVVTHDDDRLLFVPDTAAMDIRFDGITTVCVECNHIGEILINNVFEGHLPAVVGKRIRESHMSLETVLTMLKGLDLGNCHEVRLLHLSDGNSDEKRMIREVEQALGIPVYAEV